MASAAPKDTGDYFFDNAALIKPWPTSAISTPHGPPPEIERLSATNKSGGNNAFAINTEAHMARVEEVSRHIRRRRLQALARSVAIFFLQVVVIAVGIVIGASQRHIPQSAESVRLHSPQFRPTDFDLREQSDPVVDQVPLPFVYTQADVGRSGRHLS
ncbi:MAG: hypothetical protein JWN23_2263 [Rhodocyclales bacterium]|nr:hypothetical protein [Rhodocyclales bacterium]